MHPAGGTVQKIARAMAAICGTLLQFAFEFTYYLAYILHIRIYIYTGDFKSNTENRIQYGRRAMRGCADDSDG